MGTLERRVGNREAALPWSASQEVREFVATEAATGAPVAKDRGGGMGSEGAGGFHSGSSIGESYVVGLPFQVVARGLVTSSRGPVQVPSGLRKTDTHREPAGA